MPSQQLTSPPLHELLPNRLAGSARRWQLLGGSLLIALTFLVYWPSVHGEFIIDDDILLAKSDLIKASDGLYQFWFTTKPIDYWPVTNSTLWIEWRLWGENTTGYHVVNLLLHVASSLLIWAILRRLAIPGSYLAALLYAVHPLNVQSVAWISQSKNTLSMFFFLLALLWWIKADADPGTTGDNRRERQAVSPLSNHAVWYRLSLAAFVMAMLSKGSVAVLPLMLLVLIWWQRGRVDQRDLLRTAPFFVVALILTGVNVWFQTHGTAVVVRDVNFWQRLAGAGAVVWFYVYKAIIPINLVFIYPQWNIDVGQIQWWLPDLGCIAITALLLWKRHNRWGRPILFSWALTCIALMPVLGFTDVGWMKFSLVADHYAYIALIPIMALVAAGCMIWYRRSESTLRFAAAITIAVLVVTRLFLTWQRSMVFADAITLYERILEKNPKSWLPHHNLGVAYAKIGRDEKAIEQFQAALDDGDTDNTATRYDWGNALSRLGRYSDAIVQYQRALEMDPSDANVHNNLGTVLYNLKRMSEAQLEFATAIQHKFNFPVAHYNLGMLLLDEGQPKTAVTSLETAIGQRHDYIKAWKKLAVAYQQLGLSDKAHEATQTAIQILRQQGTEDEAAQLEKKLDTAPRDTQTDKADRAPSSSAASR